jgi:nicotinic acid mononucleotide adenylyltransferase
MRIGLLGGSFNPPHAAHRAISLFAIKRLKLDRVWWLLTPGNPLKDHGGLRDLGQRADAARRTAHDPRIDVSCLEAVIGTRYTVDTITHLRRRVSGVRLVWIMGADNLAQFHRWKDWRRIAAEVPIAVIAGAGALSSAREPGGTTGGSAATRLGLPHRHETQSVVDWPAEPGRELADEPSGSMTLEVSIGAIWNIETINPTCVV